MATTMARAAATDAHFRPGPPVIPEDIEKLCIHMVGIGGCGMSGLAALLRHRGARVTGSDAQSSDTTARLSELGVPITTPQTAEALPPDAELVVISAAIPADHVERLEAHRRGLRVIRYAQLLGLMMSRYEGIAISGTHGKSTTTAWVAYTLRRAGLDPTFVVGDMVDQLGGGSGVGNGRHFVAEACEYDRSFLNLTPRTAVILNIEEDHLDCYQDVAAIQKAFTQFAHRVPSDGLVIVNGQDARCRALADRLSRNVETFGTTGRAAWRVDNLSLEEGRYAFDVHHLDQRLGRARLGLAGRHNVDNALAVIAVASRCGVAWDDIRLGLAEFQGARRRLEKRGEVNGILVVDDYAHHPTEIRATLHAARQRFRPRRLRCVFQPHQHSRTRFLMADFARSFSDADEVIVPDIYFVRDSERERERVSAQDLIAAIRRDGGNARYIGEFADIIAGLVHEAQAGDVVLTMGAGDIWKVADGLVERLGGDLPG